MKRSSVFLDRRLRWRHRTSGGDVLGASAICSVGIAYQTREHWKHRLRAEFEFRGWAGVVVPRKGASLRVASLSQFYFMKRLSPTFKLSAVQSAILCGMGMQFKSVDELVAELKLPTNQVLTMLNRAVKKISIASHWRQCVAAILPLFSNYAPACHS